MNVMAEETKLTTKQIKAIPKLLAAENYEKGCKAAKISRTTLHTWLQDEGFAAEFDRQRSMIVEAAFAMIAQNVEQAVIALVGLLDTNDDRVKRLAANDVINHFTKRHEMVDLEDRIQRIEERLETRG